MFYIVEEDKITFYKLSLLFKCLIAFVFFITFMPFIFWFFSSKTFIQHIIMFFISLVFIFVIPLMVLLSNKKTEILKNERIIRITVYFYKYNKTKEYKYSDVSEVCIKPLIRRKNNYLKKWWQVYLRLKNNKNINLHSSIAENESKEIAVKTGKLINIDVINEESNEVLDYKLFEADKLYIEKITQIESKLKKLEKPKNIYKDDYGKRVIYRWYNVNALEFILMFLNLYLLLFLDFIIYKRKYLIFLTVTKIIILFVIYFIIRYAWLVFFDKGWCELKQDSIKIRKNIFIFPKTITILWNDIKDISIKSEYYSKLVFKTKSKLLTLYFTKDKIFWLKNEIDNYVKSHF